MITEESKKKRLERDTKIIVDTLLRELPEKPLAILLYGGYGRGEGAWFEDENGHTTPYNDYDIDIITPQKISHQKLQTLRKELANMVGIKWIDLGVIPPHAIRKYKATIQNIDLKEASTLLYGNKDVYNLFPKMGKKEIGRFDILKLYTTRIWTFLGSWNGPFHNLDLEESRFFKNQMAKAILATCDLLLIAKKQYTTSYVKRAEIAPTLYDIDKLKEYSEWAITEKLQPSSTQMSKDEMIRMYIDVRALFIEAMGLSLKQEWKYFENPDRTFHHCYYKLTNVLRSVYYIMKGHTDVTRKKIDILCAQNYVFQAFRVDGYNDNYLKNASAILQKWGYINSPVWDWDELRLLTANARNNI